MTHHMHELKGNIKQEIGKLRGDAALQHRRARARVNYTAIGLECAEQAYARYPRWCVYAVLIRMPDERLLSSHRFSGASAAVMPDATSTSVSSSTSQPQRFLTT